MERSSSARSRQYLGSLMKGWVKVIPLSRPIPFGPLPTVQGLLRYHYRSIKYHDRKEARPSRQRKFALLPFVGSSVVNRASLMALEFHVGIGTMRKLRGLMNGLGYLHSKPPRHQTRKPIVSDAERYRRQAEECRQQAAKAISELDKEQWLALAADWLAMAQTAQAREGRPPKCRHLSRRDRARPWRARNLRR